jgi:hypothetical protein
MKRLMEYLPSMETTGSLLELSYSNFLSLEKLQRLLSMITLLLTTTTSLFTPEEDPTVMKFGFVFSRRPMPSCTETTLTSGVDRSPWH